MKKRIATIPKFAYDKMRENIKMGFTPVIPNIKSITDPYGGQIGIDDEYKLYAYINEHWEEVKFPEAINIVGYYKFGEFQTYYLYWINYLRPENYNGVYMLTTVPFYEMDSRLLEMDDDKIHEVICEFASKVVHAGGEVIFTETQSEAGMQAVIKSEQYKYAMIETIIKQFENVSIEFIPHDTDDIENSKEVTENEN